MRYSKQREIIYNTLLESKEHPTANTVYDTVRREHPSISLATVYRNLNMLESSGKIMRISVPDGGDHFDGHIEDHFHIICEKCGEISDIFIPFPSQLDKQITSETGFAVTGHQLLLTGICKKCSLKTDE